MTDQFVYLFQHYVFLGVNRRPDMGETAVFDDPYDPERYYKIGIAADPEKRRSILSAGTPHKLRLETTISPESDAAELETALHRLYGDLIDDEWFKIPPEHVNVLSEIETLSAERIHAIRRKRLEMDGIIYDIKLDEELTEGNA